MREPPAPVGERAAGPSRLLWVDAARSLAVALALLAHGSARFHALRLLPEGAGGALRIVFHAATPAFFLLFGAMLEIVARRRLRSAGPPALGRWLLRRSALCYLAYAATVAAALVAGRADAIDAARAAVFLHELKYTSTLAFYTLAMLAAFPLVLLVDRHGHAPVLGGALGLWLLVPGLDLLSWPARGEPLVMLAGLLVGRPAGHLSNSLLQSLMLVVFGMCIGRAILAGQRSGSWGELHRTLARGIAGAALWAAAILLRDGPAAVYAGYALSASLRNRQAAGYVVIAALSGLLLLLAVIRAIGPGRTYRPPGGAALLFGRHSLAAFSLGNILLILAPARLGRLLDPSWRPLFPLVHVAVVLALLALWQRMRGAVTPAGQDRQLPLSPFGKGGKGGFDESA